MMVIAKVKKLNTTPVMPGTTVEVSVFSRNHSKMTSKQQTPFSDIAKRQTDKIDQSRRGVGLQAG